MKPKLTRRNAAAIAKYADLVGLTPNKFLNKFLEDELTIPFEDLGDGRAEGYLGDFRISERAIAERLAAWMQTRLIDNQEVKHEIEVVELPKGGFRISAAFFSHGHMYRISG